MADTSPEKDVLDAAEAKVGEELDAIVEGLRELVERARAVKARSSRLTAHKARGETLENQLRTLLSTVDAKASPPTGNGESVNTELAEKVKAAKEKEGP